MGFSSTHSSDLTADRVSPISKRRILVIDDEADIRELVAGILDTELEQLHPDTRLGEIARYCAAYNLVAGPVVDAEGHLLGAVTVDDVLDHLLPQDWRDHFADDRPDEEAAAADRTGVNRA